MALSREDLRRLAIQGAKTRLSELEAERRGLLREFPELSGARKAVRGGAGSRPRTRRRNLNAAQRRAISKRMKLLWAERRKKKGKAA